MFNHESEILVTVLVTTCILTLFVGFILIFTRMFQNKQSLHEQEQAAIQSRFAREILQSQIEVQNDTMQKIGEELHDNVGQLLTVLKINLSLLEQANLSPEPRALLQQAKEVCIQSIQGVRDIARSLDGDFIKSFGLERSLDYEVQRINKVGQLIINLEVSGSRLTIGFDKEIVLFRIAQEAINNSLKHANASEITINLCYSTSGIVFLIQDNGNGFNLSDYASSSSATGRGLTNLKRRAGSIGAVLRIISEPGKGTTIAIDLQMQNISIA